MGPFWILLTLALSRFIPLMMLTPFGLLDQVPPVARMGMAGLMALIAWPWLLAHSSPAPAGARLVLLYAENLILGWGMALVPLLVASVLNVIGETLDANFGWALVQIVSVNRQPTSLMGTLFPLVGGMLLVSLGGLSVIFGVLIRSVVAHPVTQTLVSGGWLHGLAVLAAGAWQYGLELTAPMLVILLMINMVTGVLSRLIPQFQVLTLQFPLLTLVGTGIVLIAWPSLASLTSALLSVMQSALSGLMAAI